MGRLQSSMEDVVVEVDHIRGHDDHKNSYVIFMGEDGLSTMRHATLLERGPRGYLYTTPATIPMQGEKPHGIQRI